MSAEPPPVIQENYGKIWGVHLTKNIIVDLSWLCCCFYLDGTDLYDLWVEHWVINQFIIGGFFLRLLAEISNLLIVNGGLLDCRISLPFCNQTWQQKIPYPYNINCDLSAKSSNKN